MSFAYALDVCTVPVRRAGVLARDICRRGGRGEIAAVFERSLYLRIGEEFICVGEPAIGNGPTTLIITARVAELGLRQGQRAFVSNERIEVSDFLLDFGNCATWRAPRWPDLPCPAALLAACAEIARRAAAESPADGLARAIFGDDDTPLTRLARPRVANFAAWISSALSTAQNLPDQTVAGQRAPSLPPRPQRAVGRVASEASRVGGPGVSDPLSVIKRQDPLSDHRSPIADHSSPPTPDPSPPRFAGGEGNPAAGATELIGLGPGLTPSGDDFLIGALAMLDALEQTNTHAALGEAILATASRTSPLSASLLRAATAGHVGENLHTMVAAVIAGDAEAALAAAARVGHTSGWDALAGAVVTAWNANDYRC
jgi:hypothetical protein